MQHTRFYVTRFSGPHDFPHYCHLIQYELHSKYHCIDKNTAEKPQDSRVFLLAARSSVSPCSQMPNDYRISIHIVRTHTLRIVLFQVNTNAILEHILLLCCLKKCAIARRIDDFSFTRYHNLSYSVSFLLCLCVSFIELRPNNKRASARNKNNCNGQVGAWRMLAEYGCWLDWPLGTLQCK